MNFALDVLTQLHPILLSATTHPAGAQTEPQRPDKQGAREHIQLIWEHVILVDWGFLRIP